MGQIRPPKTNAERQAHENNLRAAVGGFHPDERALLKFSEDLHYSDLAFLQVLAEEGSIELDQKAREFISLTMNNRGFIKDAPREVVIKIRATFEWQRFWGAERFKYEHFEDIINLH